MAPTPWCCEVHPGKHCHEAYVFFATTHLLQYHTTSPHKNLTNQTTLSYDGMADFYVKRYEDFEKAYEDPYYKNVVKPDEAYLFDVENMRVMVGTETCVIEGGHIVEGRDQKG